MNKPKYPVDPKMPLTEDCKVLKYYAKSVEKRGLYAVKCTSMVPLEKAEDAAEKWRAQGLTINIFACYTSGVYAF